MGCRIRVRIKDETVRNYDLDDVKRNLKAAVMLCHAFCSVSNTLRQSSLISGGIVGPVSLRDCDFGCGTELPELSRALARPPNSAECSPAFFVDLHETSRTTALPLTIRSV